MSVKVKRIAHLGICVRSIEKSLKLYCDALGFEMVGEINTIIDDEEGKGHGFTDVKDFSYRNCFVRIPSGELLELIEFVNPKATNRDVGRLITIGKGHIAYSVSNLELYRKRMMDAGYEFFYRPLPFGDNTWSYMTDADGMILEFMQEANADTSQDYIKLLHVGHTVTDMDKAIDFFENTMGFKMVMKPELETDEMEAKGLGYLELQNVTSATAMFEMPSGQIIEALYYEYPKISDVTPTPLNYVGKHHVAYEVENMEEAQAELKKAGCEPLYKPLDDGNVCWEYMKNFEGTVFELTQE